MPSNETNSTSQILVDLLESGPAHTTTPSPSTVLPTLLRGETGGVNGALLSMEPGVPGADRGEGLSLGEILALGDGTFPNVGPCLGVGSSGGRWPLEIPFGAPLPL